jgi:hypothetical protein
VAAALWILQDPSRQVAAPALQNVTPEDGEESAITIFGLTLYRNGNALRVFLATDALVDLSDPNEVRLASELQENSTTENDANPYPDPQRVVTKLMKRYLDGSGKEPLTHTAKTFISAIGLAQIDVAVQALENACEQLQRLKANNVAPRLNESIQQRTKRIDNSAKAISKFARERTAPKFCEEENSFVDGEATQLMKEDPQQVLKPDEKSQIGKVSAWFNGL